MPSFQDSAVIFFLALLLFGPKKLPELARQLGKLMGEFRRASNEFRMQMEDELRTSEQEERQKQIAAIAAAAPAPAPIAENSIAQPAAEPGPARHTSARAPERARARAHRHFGLARPPAPEILTPACRSPAPPRDRQISRPHSTRSRIRA